MNAHPLHPLFARFRLGMASLLLWALMFALSACSKADPKEVQIEPERKEEILVALHAFYNGLEKGDIKAAYFATANGAPMQSHIYWNMEEWRGYAKETVDFFERLQSRIQENNGIAGFEIQAFQAGTPKSSAFNLSPYDHVSYKVIYNNGRSFVDKDRRLIRLWKLTNKHGDRLAMVNYGGEIASYPEGEIYAMEIGNKVEKDSELGIPHGS